MSVRFSIALFLSIAPLSVFAQGNIDWEELWKIEHPTTTNGPYGWMVGPAQYTGLAYDKWRDVVYVVNPAVCSVGQNAFGCPKIHVLDAKTGAISTSVGRSLTGAPGQIAVPPDTIHSFPVLGWPSNSFSSFSQGTIPIYKIDLDDEGRIFASNLVSPIYGICFPGPPPHCDPIYLAQGPFRIYRWDSPTASPVRVFVTLDSTQSDHGSYGSSSMPYQRWGDALDVVGKRDTIAGPPMRIVDSVRIYATGGMFQTMSQPSHLSIITLNPDSVKLSNGLGQPLDYRQFALQTSPTSAFNATGIAVTGNSVLSDIWTDYPGLPASLTTPNYSGGFVTPLFSLPEDTLNGTGYSGSIAYVQIPNKKLLISADGYNAIQVPPFANYHTRARVVNVTDPQNPYREPRGNTPHLGNRSFSYNGLAGNSVLDIDYKIEYNQSTNRFQIVLFVLMSNNGIAAYRSRSPIWPVELQTFKADVEKDDVRLSWITAKETGNLGFEIHRSFNGGSNWERISFVEGKGSTSIENRYEYIDPITDVHRNIGLVHYRLIQIDVDGGTEHSPIVSARIAASTKDFEFLPHTIQPASAPKISFAMKEAGHVTLKLYSMLGEELATVTDGWRSAGVHEQSIASPLPSGVNLCIAQTASGVYSTRFVLTR